MIKLEHVSKAYAGNKVYAVHDVSFEAKAGEVFGFLGPNGAGKTTTIKMLTGALQLTEGKITVCGHDMSKDFIEAKRNIGFVPDDQVLYEKLSGREYVNFVSDIYGTSILDRKARADVLLEKLGLASDFDQSISTYSHGMRQKISIIAALVHNPDVWILDEPITGLDPQSAFELKKLMREHASQNKTVLFSTHVLEIAEKVCDRIGIINHGRMLAVGTIAEMRSAFGTDLESAFIRIIEEDNAAIASEMNHAESAFEPRNLEVRLPTVQAEHAQTAEESPSEKDAK